MVHNLLEVVYQSFLSIFRDHLTNDLFKHSYARGALNGVWIRATGSIIQEKAAWRSYPREGELLGGRHVGILHAHTTL